MDYIDQIIEVKKRGLRNEDIANFVGVSCHAVYNWMRQVNRDIPDITNQKKIKEYYDMIVREKQIKINWPSVVTQLVERLSMPSLMRALELHSERTIKRWMDGTAVPGSRRSVMILSAFNRAFDDK